MNRAELLISKPTRTGNKCEGREKQAIPTITALLPSTKLLHPYRAGGSGKTKLNWSTSRLIAKTAEPPKKNRFLLGDYMSALEPLFSDVNVMSKRLLLFSSDFYWTHQQTFEVIYQQMVLTLLDTDIPLYQGFQGYASQLVQR